MQPKLTNTAKLALVCEQRDDLLVEVEALRRALREARAEVAELTMDLNDMRGQRNAARDDAAILHAEVTAARKERDEIMALLQTPVRLAVQTMLENRSKHAKRERERDSAIVRAAKTSPGEG